MLSVCFAVLFPEDIAGQGEDSSFISNIHKRYLLEYNALKSFNRDTLYRRYATRGYKDVVDELCFYQTEIVATLPYKEVLVEVEAMKNAARNYESEELACEAEYMQVIFLPECSTEERMTKCEEMEELIGEAARRGDTTIKLRVMEQLLAFHRRESPPSYNKIFKQARTLEEELSRVSCCEYPQRNNTYYTLALLYYSFHDFDRTVPYLKEALKDSTRYFYDSSNLQSRHVLGRYYSSVNQLALSDHYFRSICESSDICKDRPLYNWKAIAGLAENQRKRKNYDRAIRMFRFSLPGVLREKDYAFASRITMGLGECYLEKDDIALVRDMIDSTRVHIHRSGAVARYKRLYPLMCKYYAESGNVELSQLYLDSAIYMMTKYQNEFNEVNILRGEQEFYESEKRIRDVLIGRQKGQLLLSVIVTFFSLFVIALVTYLYHRYRVAYRLLVLHNQEWAGVQVHVSEPEMALLPHVDKPEPHTFSREDKKLFKAVSLLLANDRLYREPDLTLETAASRLHTTRNRLSRAINLSTGKNFNNFINEYRVKEAVRLLSLTKPNADSIDEIMLKVGFNSRSSFYLAFKKVTGLSPSEFKQNRS